MTGSFSQSGRCAHRQPFELRLGEVVGKQGVDRGQPRLGQRPFGIEQVELAEFAFAIADAGDAGGLRRRRERSDEHTSELQSLIRISYAAFSLKKINKQNAYRQLS